MQNENAKPISISKQLIYEAFKSVKANRGSAGVDKVTIKDYENNLRSNLYKLWNRMSSGSYFPPPVKLVEIPKSNGGKRPLGIPTVSDRIAQMAVVKLITPGIEPYFHEDSYAYRPHRFAHDAVAKAQERCWKYDWVLDMDISKFFDTIDQELLMKALKLHTKEKWVLMYIERWLKVPYEKHDGSIIPRDKGVPQGSVIGPVLANLFLHYTFDKWMEKTYSRIPFERYADDTICHCRSLEQAEFIRAEIQRRFDSCKLKLNNEKTKIVYCKSSRRNTDYPNVTFDFLGFTFQPRESVDKNGIRFTGFLPAISKKSMKRINETIHSWHLNMRSYQTLEYIATEINPVVRGWITYYGRFYPSRLKKFMQILNGRLARWVMCKFERYKHRFYPAQEWLAHVAEKEGLIFYHWKCGVLPRFTNKVKVCSQLILVK
jgi:RNA-directed DNA polymerase